MSRMNRIDFNEMPIPVYASAATDISGCDASNNPIDASGAIVTTPCNPAYFLTYNCKTGKCEWSWLSIGLTIVAGVLLLALIIWAIYALTRTPSKR